MLVVHLVFTKVFTNFKVIVEQNLSRQLFIIQLVNIKSLLKLMADTTDPYLANDSDPDEDEDVPSPVLKPISSPTKDDSDDLDADERSNAWNKHPLEPSSAPLPINLPSIYKPISKPKIPVPNLATDPVSQINSKLNPKMTVAAVTNPPLKPTVLGQKTPKTADPTVKDTDLVDLSRISPTSPANLQEKHQDVKVVVTPSSNSGYDENGLRTVVEYYVNDKGQKIKVTRVLRLVKKTVTVNKRVAERRGWAKFGDCLGKPPGPEDSITHKSHEIIRLDLKPKLLEINGHEVDDDLELNLGNLEGKTVICNYCKESGHWSMKCPKRAAIDIPVESGAIGSVDKKTDALAQDRNADYVPLHVRNGAAATASSLISDEGHTVRISNLSEDATEVDLQELCRRFGHTNRIFLAKDYQTYKSRGYAFVTYKNREDALTAIEKLNRHPYDNLILSVDWAQPRGPRTDRPTSDLSSRGRGRGRGYGTGFSVRGGGGRGHGDRQRTPLALKPRTKQ